MVKIALGPGDGRLYTPEEFPVFLGDNSMLQKRMIFKGSMLADLIKY